MIEELIAKLLCGKNTHPSAMSTSWKHSFTVWLISFDSFLIWIFQIHPSISQWLAFSLTVTTTAGMDFIINRQYILASMSPPLMSREMTFNSLYLFRQGQRRPIQCYWCDRWKGKSFPEKTSSYRIIFAFAVSTKPQGKTVSSVSRTQSYIRRFTALSIPFILLISKLRPFSPSSHRTYSTALLNYSHWYNFYNEGKDSLISGPSIRLSVLQSGRWVQFATKQDKSWSRQDPVSREIN